MISTSTWQILRIWKFWIDKKSMGPGYTRARFLQNTPDIYISKFKMGNLHRCGMFLEGQEELKITYPFSYITGLENTL